jgi:hypothetical protein
MLYINFMFEIVLRLKFVIAFVDGWCKIVSVTIGIREPTIALTNFSAKAYKW